jgi:hypothetical protein
MLANLALGTLMISLTVLMHSAGFVILTREMNRIVGWFRFRHFAKTVAMVAIVLGIFLLHSTAVWAWAALYVAIGEIIRFEDALYFSTVTFSTAGYGDITLSQQWRLLSSLEAINGFMLIGWSTAYLVTASTRHGPFRLGEHF